MGGGPGGGDGGDPHGPDSPAPGFGPSLGPSTPGTGPGEGGPFGPDSPAPGPGPGLGPPGPSASPSKSTSPETLNALITALPVIGPVNAGLEAAGLTTLGDLAKGDPNPDFGTGVSGPEGSPGVGGGPTDFSKSKKNQKTVAKTAPQKTQTPTTLDDIFKSPPPVIDISKRRRFGRQQTILTGDLGEAPVARPTLLGQ